MRIERIGDTSMSAKSQNRVSILAAANRWIREGSTNYRLTNNRKLQLSVFRIRGQYAGIVFDFAAPLGSEASCRVLWPRQSEQGVRQAAMKLIAA
jgi:hypothetical protein